MSNRTTAAKLEAIRVLRVSIGAYSYGWIHINLLENALLLRGQVLDLFCQLLQLLPPELGRPGKIFFDMDTGGSFQDLGLPQDVLLVGPFLVKIFATILAFSYQQ